MTPIALAIVLFVATNVDDILLLSLFFADRRYRVRSVVIGQFAGIAVLTAGSAGAALLAVSIPDAWIALIGLFPLALGLRGFYELWQSSDDDEVLTLPGERGRHTQWIAVALVTIANGGDNLGVYIPVFAREVSGIPVYATVFGIMTALWCAAGYWLVQHPLVGAHIRRYGHIILPFVLTGLGLYVLSDVWQND